MSYAFIGFCLLLPYLEPYLIRTMKEARRQIRDPELQANLEKFNAQEGQHFRQHVRFNDVVRGNRFAGLRALEDALDADYRRFSRTKSLKWNLAYAEGFEAFTTASARFSFEMGFEGMHPALRDLYDWHLLEELEHRTVAFDVYDHIYGDYVYRLCVGLRAQWHMLRFTMRAASHMLGADPEALPKYGGRAGRRARGLAQLRRMGPSMLPKVLPTYTPWYTPHDIPMPAGIQAMQERYTAMAVRVS